MCRCRSDLSVAMPIDLLVYMLFDPSVDVWVDLSADLSIDMWVDLTALM